MACGHEKLVRGYGHLPEGLGRYALCEACGQLAEFVPELKWLAHPLPPIGSPRRFVPEGVRRTLRGEGYSASLRDIDRAWTEADSAGDWEHGTPRPTSEIIRSYLVAE